VRGKFWEGGRLVRPRVRAEGPLSRRPPHPAWPSARPASPARGEAGSSEAGPACHSRESGNPEGISEFPLAQQGHRSRHKGVLDSCLRRNDTSLLRRNDTSLLRRNDTSLLRRNDTSLLRRNDTSLPPPVAVHGQGKGEVAFGENLTETHGCNRTISVHSRGSSRMVFPLSGRSTRTAAPSVLVAFWKGGDWDSSIRRVGIGW